jgi:hypothetical protein
MTKLADPTATRIKKRSLPDLLVNKFLTEYGYDHGPVIARAIVDDILATVEQCYPDRIQPKTVLWLAVRRENGGRRKGLDITDLIPVRLQVITDHEVGLLTNEQLQNAGRPDALSTGPASRAGVSKHMSKEGSSPS